MRRRHGAAASDRTGTGHWLWLWALGLGLWAQGLGLGLRRRQACPEGWHRRLGEGAVKGVGLAQGLNWRQQRQRRAHADAAALAGPRRGGQRHEGGAQTRDQRDDGDGGQGEGRQHQRRGHRHDGGWRVRVAWRGRGGARGGAGPRLVVRGRGEALGRHRVPGRAAPRPGLGAAARRGCLRCRGRSGADRTQGVAEEAVEGM